MEGLVTAPFCLIVISTGARASTISFKAMATNLSSLSPAAQAVLKAVQATMPDYMMTDSTAGCFAAAALLAAADQVVSIKEEPSEPPGYGVGYEPAEYLQDWTRWHVRSQFLAIAAELEGQS